MNNSPKKFFFKNIMIYNCIIACFTSCHDAYSKIECHDAYFICYEQRPANRDSRMQYTCINAIHKKFAEVQNFL